MNQHISELGPPQNLLVYYNPSPYFEASCWWKKSFEHQLRLVVNIPVFTSGFKNKQIKNEWNNKSIIMIVCTYKSYTVLYYIIWLYLIIQAYKNNSSSKTVPFLFTEALCFGRHFAFHFLLRLESFMEVYFFAREDMPLGDYMNEQPWIKFNDSGWMKSYPYLAGSPIRLT